MVMPATKGNDQIIDMEPTRYYQTVGIPLKGAIELPPTHQYLTGTKIENLKPQRGSNNCCPTCIASND